MSLKRSHKQCARLISRLLIIMLLPHLAFSQDQNQGTVYQLPPQAMVDLVDAPPTPAVSVDPTSTYMLLMERASLPSIAELAQPELRIAGIRINPRSNSRSRTRPFSGLRILKISDGKERQITGLHGGERIGGVSWSPDAKHIAFTVTGDKGVMLWLADVKSAVAKPLLDRPLNGAYGTTYAWLADSKTLVCKIINPNRGTRPMRPTVPGGPLSQENIGKTAAARTYQDLIKNEHDAALFEYHLDSEVILVGVTGEIRNLGVKGLISSISPSPNGEFLMVTTIHRPFSYLVPVYRFPRKVAIHNLNGDWVTTIAELPLAEEIPIGRGAVSEGPRSIAWRSDTPATVAWVEAQDGGDPRAQTAVRDKVFTLSAPFDGGKAPLISLSLRFRRIIWGNENVALVDENWWRNRTTRTWLVDPANPKKQPSTLFDYSSEDRYNNPGSPWTRTTAGGHRVLLTDKDGRTIFLSGQGASPEGNRPFLDQLNLTNGKTSRLWRSASPYYEYAVAFADLNKRQVITRRESKTEPPNYYVRQLKKDNTRQLTHFQHPSPQMIGIQKELITYMRKDGVQLSATLYLPEGYQPSDGPLPTLMWAYPREYKSASAASQVTGSPHQFVRISSSSPLLFLTQGYAVLNGPTMPIIGEGNEEPNDTFVEQLVSSAEAAIDEMVRRGVGDRDRMAISGHSYGAFMTANLLAHSDLYRAGIARSGAYNRTFTPFGFQSEERTFWEAPDIYFRMSPFMHANKVNEPILLIHGQVDNNSGTFPVQSERYYNALKGHGATARLVMLPHESHGYAARESVLHVLWEMTQWLDTYVKNAKPKVTIGSH